MRQITRDANELKENDLISVLLYGLYKVGNVPEYSAISELAYTLSKDDLFRLCATFGGVTIKIPTLDELKTMSKTLLVIDLTCKGMSFEDACKEAEVEDIEPVVKAYEIMSRAIEEFR